KWVDSSISVTYMLPEGSDWKDVYEFILEGHKREVKSIAAFPDKKMYGIVTTIPFKTLAVNLTNGGMKIKEENFSKDELIDLEEACGNIVASSLTDENGRPIKITRTQAPKRPTALPCDIHRVTYDGKKWTVIVGLLADEPYEVFLGYSKDIDLPEKQKAGKLTRSARGKYSIYLDNSDEPAVKDVIEAFDNAKFAWSTRLISTSLRHGINPEFLIMQLSKDGHILDMNRVLSRVLKKYIPDGQTVTSGMTCKGKLSSGTVCGSKNLQYSDGCAVCNDC